MKNEMTTKNYYSLFVFFAFLLINDTIFAQENSSEYLKNIVSSNIISYNIKQGLEQGDVLNDFILTKPPPRFFQYIPNSKGELLLKMAKVENNGAYSYPNDNYKLYSFNHDDYEIGYHHKEYNSMIQLNYFVAGSENYLVAFNETTKDTKFISGHYFLSFIASDFSLNKREPNSYINFINLKTYNLKIKNTRYFKRNLKYLIFSAYSDEYKNEVLIYVKKSNPDIIKVRPIIE